MCRLFHRSNVNSFFCDSKVHPSTSFCVILLNSAFFCFTSKLAYCPSITWLVMRFLRNVTLQFLPPNFIVLSHFFPLFNYGFASFYWSQVYDEMSRQVMDAILAMVFFVFHFNVIYKQFVSQFIMTIDGNLLGSTNQEMLDFVCQLSTWVLHLH